MRRGADIEPRNGTGFGQKGRRCHLTTDLRDVADPWIILALYRVEFDFLCSLHFGSRLSQKFMAK
jgi:hypothetical protein